MYLPPRRRIKIPNRCNNELFQIQLEIVMFRIQTFEAFRQHNLMRQASLHSIVITFPCLLKY